MRKRWFILFLLILLLGINFQNALAVTYLFKVPKAEVNVWANTDGTASVEYTYQFANDPGADPIDFIDISVPTDSYDKSTIQADVDGQAITSIEDSPYVKPGIALGLGSNAIRPGNTGNVHVYIPKVYKIFHPGTQKESEEYASFQFAPTTFDTQFVSGTTDLRVTLFLPPGLNENEPRYFNPEGWPGSATPESGINNENRVFYSWHDTNANSYTKYIFGAAFPARLLPANAIQRQPSITFNTDNLCGWLFCLGFAGFFGLIAYASIVGNRKRKLQYLPPKIAIEGHGIKRGLTSVEAAILMEQPMDKILTMILFSTIKKGAATVLSRDPIKIQVADPRPDSLQDYEKAFLTAFDKTDLAERRTELQTMMIGLVKNVQEKMRGFSRRETVDYYQDIIRRAWEQVETADTPEVKMEKFDEYLGWTMLDRNYDRRTQDVFSGGPVFIPTWWGHFDPTYRNTTTGTFHTAAPAPAGSIGSGKTAIPLPNLPGSNFALSMVNGIQSFSNNVIGNVSNFTGTITNKTNPIPVPSSSSRSIGGGGRSCACACACAGCACACAGGGR